MEPTTAPKVARPLSFFDIVLETAVHQRVFFI